MKRDFIYKEGVTVTTNIQCICAYCSADIYTFKKETVINNTHLCIMSRLSCCFSCSHFPNYMFLLLHSSFHLFLFNSLASSSSHPVVLLFVWPVGFIAMLELESVWSVLAIVWPTEHFGLSQNELSIMPRANADELITMTVRKRMV